MISDELVKLKELTKTLTSNGYLTDQTVAWEYAFNSVNELVCITNIECKIKFLNARFLEKLQFEHDHYINSYIGELFVSHSVDDIVCDTNGETIVGNKERFFPEFGGWFVRNRYVIKNKLNEVIGYTFMFLDVTARKQAELNLQVSEERFEDLFRYLPSSAVVFGPINNCGNFKILAINSSAMHSEKVDSTVIGKLITDVFPGVVSFGLFSQLQEVCRTGTPITMPTSYYEDGRIQGWRSNFIFRLPSGEVVSLYTDETAKMEAQIEFKNSKETLQGIFNCIPDIIGLQDNNHNVIKYNKASLALFDVSENELKNKKCYELLGRSSPCDPCRTKRCKITKVPEKTVLYIEELGGWYDSRSYPVLDGSGNVVQVVEHLRDITEFKEAQEKRDFYYSEMTSVFKRLYFIVSAVDGYIWEKYLVDDTQLVYNYIDARLCKLLYGLKSNVSEDTDNFICSGALGKTATELILNFSKDTRVHSFIDICTVAEEHCLMKKKYCDYFEMGYIENQIGDLEWIVLRVRKKPVTDSYGKITGVIGFADVCTNDMYSIRQLLVDGLAEGSIEKLADTGKAKVYYVVNEKQEAVDLEYKDFP